MKQLRAATGGPRTYSGSDMKTTHGGLKITEAEFSAVGENLVKVLDAFRVLPVHGEGESSSPASGGGEEGEAYV
jgi:hemoglobin